MYTGSSKCEKSNYVINNHLNKLFNDLPSSQHDVLYVDNFSNFYTYKEVAKQSRLSWLFIVFDPEKEDICSKEKIPCIRIRPKLSFRYSDDYRTNINLFKSAISQDRILRFYPYCISSRILDNQLFWFKQIVTEVKPKLVIGEISWGNEYLFYEWCKQRNIRYRHLLNLPCEKNKIVLFDAEHSYASLAENRLGITNEERNESRAVSYYELCDKLKKYNLSGKKKNLCKVFLKVINLPRQINDYRTNQLYKKIRFILLKLYIFAEKLLFSIFRQASCVSDIIEMANGRNVVYFPLHIQPECTPDFVSIKYSKQLILLYSILKYLPETFVVAVKDHPNAISIRNIPFLTKLAKSKQIIFVNRKVSSQDVIKISACTASVAGTVTLESISNGVPSFVFSNIFYNHSRFVTNVTRIEEFAQLVCNIYRDGVYNDLCLKDFGVTGFIHDPDIFCEVFESSNMQNISLLIDSYVAKYQSISNIDDSSDNPRHFSCALTQLLSARSSITEKSAST